MFTRPGPHPYLFPQEAALEFGKSPSDAGADPDESQAFSADVLWQPLWFSERDADATNAGFLYDIYSLLKPAPFRFYSLYVSH